MTDNTETVKHGDFSVGDKVAVGSFFSIDKYYHITFDRDAVHRDGFRTDGSVDVNCTLTIRGFEKVGSHDMAVVRLDRPTRPYGSMAPTGQVFLILVSAIEEWAEAAKRMADHEKRRKGLAGRYRR